MPDRPVDVPFGTKVEALIRSAGLDPDLMEMADFSMRAPWIFYTAWMSFHPELKRARTLKFFGDNRNADDISNTMSEHDSNEGRVKEVLEGIMSVYSDMLVKAEEVAAAVDPARPGSAAAATSRSTPSLLQPVLNTSGTKVSLRSEVNIQIRRNLKIVSKISVKDVCAGEPQALGELVAVLFQEGQRLWETVYENKEKAHAPSSAVKRIRPKSAAATAKKASLSRMAYLVPSPIPGVPTPKDMVQTKKKETEALLNKKRVKMGATCDVPTNPYIKHLTIEEPPSDLTIQSNVNRMKLRIAIIKNMRQNSPERPLSAPDVTGGCRTSSDLSTAAPSTLPSALATGGTEDGFGMNTHAAEAFPLQESIEAPHTGLKSGPGPGPGTGAGAGAGVGPPSPISSFPSPKKAPIGGPVPDMEYGVQYNGFGAFLLDKLKKKAKGRALDEQQEEEEKESKKKKKKRKAKSKGPSPLEDLLEDVTLLGPALEKKKAADMHFAKMQEKMKKKQEEKARDPIKAALAERKKAKGPGRMTVIESHMQGGVYKPGAEIINETTNRAKYTGWMERNDLCEQSSSLSVSDEISEPSVTILGGGVSQIIKNTDITGGKLLKQRKLERRSRPGSAPAARRKGKDNIFNRLFTDACLIPKDTDVMNPDFLRSLGIDDTHELFMNIHGKPADTTSQQLKSSGPFPVVVDGAPALLTYDTVTGRKLILTPEEHAAKEANWKARNAAPSAAEMNTWTTEVDRIWSVPGTMKPPEIIKTEPTRGQWPGFNTGQRTNEWVHRARRDVLTEKFSQIGGKQSTHTTNHALSSYAIRTAKLVKDAQASSDFYALSSQTNPLDLLIAIEHCHSCSQHAMSSKHDERQYVSMANAFLRTLVEVSHAEKVCCRVGVVRFNSVLCSQGAEGENHSRIGSFEIQVIYNAPTNSRGSDSAGASGSNGIVSEILHSKLTSQRWPAKSVVEKRFKSFLHRFNVPVRDPSLPTDVMLAKSKPDGGTDGLAVYPVGPVVALDDVKVIQDKWEFTSDSAPVVEQAPLDASPQQRAIVRRNIQQATDQKEQQEKEEEIVALAEDLEMRKKELSERFMEEKESFIETKNMGDRGKVSGDPRMLSVPKGPGGGARSYISGSPSHLRARPSSPSSPMGSTRSVSPPKNRSPERKLPSVESRVLDVQWAFDCRAAARLHVYRPGDITFVLGVKHPRGGLERHAMPAEVVAVQDTNDPGSECQLTVKLKYHESTLQVSSNDCVAYRSSSGLAERSYARDSLPGEFSLLLHLLSSGPTVWKALHPGDVADPTGNSVYLTRASFFHQVRNAAAQAEAAHSREDKQAVPGKVTHPLTGAGMDLQLAYGEGTLNWAFGQSGDKVDMTALAHLAHVQYMRQESEIQMAQQLVLQKQNALEKESKSTRAAEAVSTTAAAHSTHAHSPHEHRVVHHHESASESKSPDAHHTEHASHAEHSKLHIDVSKVATNTIVGLISPRAPLAHKTSSSAEPPRHKDNSPRAQAMTHKALGNSAGSAPAAPTIAAVAADDADDADDDYGEDEWDAPTPVKPPLEDSLLSGSVEVLSTGGGDHSDLHVSGSSASASADPLQDQLTAVSSSNSHSHVPNTKEHNSVSVDSNRTQDARHDASLDAKAQADPPVAAAHKENFLLGVKHAASNAVHKVLELEKLTVHAVAHALHMDHEAASPTATTIPAPAPAPAPAAAATATATPIADPPLEPISETSPRLTSQFDKTSAGSALGQSIGLEQSVGRNLEASQASLLSEKSEASKPPGSSHYPGQGQEPEEQALVSQVSVSLSNYLAHSESGSSEEMDNDAMLALMGHKGKPHSPPNTTSSPSAAAAADDDAVDPMLQVKSPGGVKIIRESTVTAVERSPDSSIDTPPGPGTGSGHAHSMSKSPGSLGEEKEGEGGTAQQPAVPVPAPAGDGAARKIDFENSVEEGDEEADYGGDDDWD